MMTDSWKYWQRLHNTVLNYLQLMQLNCNFKCQQKGQRDDGFSKKKNLTITDVQRFKEQHEYNKNISPKRIKWKF